MKIGTLHKRHPLTAILTAFILGILLASTISYALAQVANTTYYACEKNSTGAIRMVSATTTCNSNETMISWNQIGPQGPVGPQGPQGPAGTSGGFGLPFMCNGCNLTKYASTFSGHDWSNSQIVNTRFTGQNFQGVIFKNSYFDENFLDNSDFSNADLSNLLSPANPNNQIQISAVSTNFTNANLSNDIFNNSYFTNANFQGANLTNVQFSDSYISNVFTNANFQGANLTNVQFLPGTDLTGALNMSTATLSGTIWNQVTCPDGTSSVTDGNTCINNLTPAPSTPTPTP